MPRAIASEYQTQAAALLRDPSARAECQDLIAYALSRKATLARNQAKCDALDTDPARALASGIRVEPRLPRYPGREVLPEGTPREVAGWQSAAPVAPARREVIRRARRDLRAGNVTASPAPAVDASAANGEV